VGGARQVRVTRLYIESERRAYDEQRLEIVSEDTPQRPHRVRPHSSIFAEGLGGEQSVNNLLPNTRQQEVLSRRTKVSREQSVNNLVPNTA
jgi:hypothetical protein